MSYLGMEADTGGEITGIAHVGQSVRDILITPRGSRVLRRDYGCDLYKYVDNPINKTLMLDIYFEVIDALDRLEPRLGIIRADINPAPPQGKLDIVIYAHYYPRGHLDDYSQPGVEQLRVNI